MKLTTIIALAGHLITPQNGTYHLVLSVIDPETVSGFKWTKVPRGVSAVLSSPLRRAERRIREHFSSCVYTTSLHSTVVWSICNICLLVLTA